MKQKRPYHHGNLRAELLLAALKVLGKVGPRAFTLREVARQAKVSHNAPYRHFRDKDELLAAVAAEGFERLADSMLGEAARGSDALDSLLLTGRSYVRFALRWPEHFSAMFDDHQDLTDYPAYAASGSRAFQVLLDRIVIAQNSGQLPPGDPSPLALTAWTLVHGIAKLAIAGHLPFESEQAILDFTTFATRAQADGWTNSRSLTVG